MGNNTLKPADPARSQYTIDPALLKMRGVDLPHMTSISIRELIPSIPAPLFPSDRGITAVKEGAKRSLDKIDVEKLETAGFRTDRKH